MLDPRAVALQGVGFEPPVLAVQGFASVQLYVVVGGGGGAHGVDSYKDFGKNLLKSTEYEDDLVQMIHRQDEEVLMVILMTVVRGDIL
jgi:hypothetical protein